MAAPAFMMCMKFVALFSLSLKCFFNFLAVFCSGSDSSPKNIINIRAISLSVRFLDIINKRFSASWIELSIAASWVSLLRNFADSKVCGSLRLSISPWDFS